MIGNVAPPCAEQGARSITLEISPAIAERYPHCRTLVILAVGVRNDVPWPETDEALSAFEAQVRDGARTMPDEHEPAVAAWHDLLRSFGTNPRRLRPSVDALGRRLARSGRLPRISPLVDTANLVSLRYTLPTGGYDLSRIERGFTLRHAAPGDEHVPLGKPDERETPVAGEVVYADGSHVLTRHWNHRDADTTKVTPQSRDVALFLEGIEPAIDRETVTRAQRELADLIAPHAQSVQLAAFEPGRATALSWQATI